MKVLYFHQYFTGRGGMGGTRSYEMARALIARGHAVKLVCGSHPLSHTGLTGKFIGGSRTGTVDSIQVVEYDLRYSNYLGVARRIYLFLRYALACIRLAIREDYDVVIATSTPLTVVLPGIAARVFRRKPFVLEIRDLWPALPRALGMRNPLLLAAMSILELGGYRAATRCIGLSPGIVAGIRRRGGGAKPVALVPNGADTDLFVPSERKGMDLPGVYQSDFVAVFCGAHGLANGLEAVLAAAEVLRRRGEQTIRFVLIGDGRHKPALVADAARRRLDNVIFANPIPKQQLAGIVGRAHVGLMLLKNVPAFYHGTSPNKFFDYLAAGLPVLCNYPGWVANLVAVHDCGIAVPPDDPERFAEALVMLQRDLPRCRAMGRRARDLAEREFSRERLAVEWVRVVESVALGRVS